jgi:thiol-disulfide isomerase/thioredoxin
MIKIKNVFFMLIFFCLSSAYATNFIGESLSSFKLVDIIAGGQITNEDLPKPPFIIHFWATWCNACDQDTANMIELAKKYPVIGVLIHDNIEDEINWLEEENNPYHLLLNDETADLAQKMKINFLPTTFLIDEYYKIAKCSEGVINDLQNF